MPLKEALETLGMGEGSQGLRWVSERKHEADEYVYLALEQADEFGARAVYFRFFNDATPPKPQIYIYEDAELGVKDVVGPDLHHRLWNAGVVPYCFIFSVSQILIYNCGLVPTWSTGNGDFITNAHDTISLLAGVQQKIDEYHARKFDSGLFWDSAVAGAFKYNQSAYEQLLGQIKNAKKHIIGEVGHDKAGLVKRILMVLILLKYLEERKDENGNGALHPKEFYKTYNPHNPTLEGVLTNPNTFATMLGDLSGKEHFNGQIFYLSQNELNDLKQTNLGVFQLFARGDATIFSSANHGLGQMSLWRLYQFNYLPIELISHIYEDFLADENGIKKKGVVYTPPYLVQFLIDRMMPLNAPKDRFQVLDPACGSGIFLVGAFKRMIQWWRIKHNWEKPTKENIEELKAILRNNIYGCDLEEEAVTLTYFSLGLTLLDALSPKEIWKNVHFDNLISQNLITGDFFKTLHEEKLDGDFDLLIGNPPFEESFTNWATKVDNQVKSEDPDRPEVPRKQIALLFLDQSFRLLRAGGTICLLLPAGPVLYNTKVHNFRKYLFRKNHFKAIFDFTALRTKLFIGSSSKAKPPVVAVFAEKANPEARSIQHVIFRRTKASSEKIEFETDHYDIHWTSHHKALSMPGIWQANFMGGGRLYNVLEKIKGKDTLLDLLDDKQRNDKWVYGDGWQERPNSVPLNRLNQLLSKKDKTPEDEAELNILVSKHKADWITGKRNIGTNGKIHFCTTTYFQWPRKRRLFEAPNLIVYKNVKGGEITSYLEKEYVTFDEAFFGIHAPPDDIKELETIQRFLADRANIGLIWLISGKVITMREAVPLMADILSLPYPKIELNHIEKILLSDIAHHLSNFRKEGEKSSVLKSPGTEDLEQFGQVFCEILNSIYGDFKSLTPVASNEFIAYPFILGEQPEIDIPDNIAGMEAKLRTLIDRQVSYNLWVKRIVKVYDKNTIILYKPNQKRYWLRSIAVRDADETFNDLYNQGK